MSAAQRPALAELSVGDSPERWEALGFAVSESSCQLGGVRIRLGMKDRGIVSPDFDRTAAMLEQAGLPLRRVRDGGGFRQGFRRIGPAILELVERTGAPAGPASFWGMVVVVEDLDGLAERLRERLGKVHPAVQSGRRIAALQRDVGISTKLAFMSPEPR